MGKNILIIDDDIQIGNLDQISVGRLFDRFYTVKSANNSVGIGLSIAKLLTEKMNGSISAELYNGKLKISVQL